LGGINVQTKLDNGNNKILYTGDLVWINKEYHYLFKELNLSYISEYEDLRARYLNFVLDTKKGNCWGTSILYLSVAERVALPLYAVSAPDHSFVRYADDYKKINIEPGYDGVYGKPVFSEEEFNKPFFP
jgi:regulator of sirC expression with transglutaminase-like and TPR domain